MRMKLWSLAMAIVGMTCSGIAIAESYNYNGVVTLCTGTCSSFASLDLGSTINGTFEINTTAGGSFGDPDVGPFVIQVLNPALPPSGPVGDPVNDNPLVLDSASGVAASNGTAGTTDGANQINGGQMLLEFLVPPFSSNGAFVVFDLTTGNGQICLFFATAGCIVGATESVRFEGSFTLSDPDSDSDGVPDSVDNCTLVANPDQRDSNGDGIGNACDADITDDCVVNFLDLGSIKLRFFTTDPDSDFSGDGIVNFIDLAVMKEGFFAPPGPSAAGCN